MNEAPKHALRRTAHLIFVCFASLAALAVADEPEPAIWQHSTSARVRLGIREKDGETPSYKTLFVVQGPNGLSFSTTLVVRYSDSGYVSFPDDFGRDWAPNGIYKWTATVKGKKVTGGRFEFFTLKNGDRGVTIPFDE